MSARVAIEVANLVQATLAVEAPLPDEHLREIAETIEEGSRDANSPFAYADARADVSPWSFRDALALLHDRFVLREGVEAFEAQREALLRRWLDQVRWGW